VDLNQYTSITVNGTNRTVSWDTNFNLTAYNGWAYAYDAENRLTSVSGNGHTATFTYDAIGRCVKRTIDNQTPIVYTYDQWTPVAEWDGNGNIMAANVFGLGDDEILYRGTTSAQLLYKSDPMGNVKFILDISSNGIEKYTYDGFGQPKITDANGNTRAASAYGNRFMFSGREYFSELGLYDMRNRVYDPVMGRFYQTGLDGLDTGSPLSNDQIPGSGDFSDLSSVGQDWLYNGGFDSALNNFFWSSLEDESYNYAGSDNPADYFDLSGFTPPPSSSGEASSSIMFDTSSVNSGPTAAQDLVASFHGGPSAQAEATNWPRVIGLVNDSLDIGDHLYTGGAQKLQKANKFGMYGKIYKGGKMGFKGNNAPGYRALDVAAAKIGQARLATAGRFIGRLGTYGGLGLAGFEVLDNGFSTRSFVKAGVGLGAPAVVRVPYVGVPLAIGIVVTDFAGGFDGFYNKFDNTPRFQIFPKPPPHPQAPVVPLHP
jgi:RHS repeat-associated protein